MKPKNDRIFTKLGEYTLLGVLSKATVQFFKNTQPFARSLTVDIFAILMWRCTVHLVSLFHIRKEKSKYFPRGPNLAQFWTQFGP